MPHISHEELNRKLSDASKVVKVGAIYQHYKFPNRNYKVTNIAIQEASEQVCIVYHDVSVVDAPSFVRDLTSWLSTVEWEGKSIPRFTLQGPTP